MLVFTVFSIIFFIFLLENFAPRVISQTHHMSDSIFAHEFCINFICKMVSLITDDCSGCSKSTQNNFFV